MREPPSLVQIAFLRGYDELFPSKNFAYVTIHPLADETDILQRLNMSPEQCAVCDLSWALGQEIAFVSVNACEQTVFVAGESTPGEKIWRNPSVSVYVDAEDPMVRHHFTVWTRRNPSPSQPSRPLSPGWKIGFTRTLSKKRNC
jgi:hypothetical protein